MYETSARLLHCIESWIVRELVYGEAHDGRHYAGDGCVSAGWLDLPDLKKYGRMHLLFPNIRAYTSRPRAGMPPLPLTSAGHPNAVANPTK